ncbi:MAG: hypothetical protein JJU33_13965 [Phycisphaerales bacterium]|nr:hypothetical protein [Phycisphaerales bacterium]
MTASFCYYFGNIALSSAAFGLIAASAASASPIAFAAEQNHRSGSDFERIAAELVLAPRPGDGDSSIGGLELAFDFAGGLFTPTFGDRNNTPPIEMLRFTFDLTGSNSPVSNGNSSSFPAIGRAPILDHADRLTPLAVVPLSKGGLLAIVEPGLIGAHRV